MSLTDPLFFDTDCLSAFLWVGNESLLYKLYGTRIMIPEQVYSELSNPGVTHLKARVDAMINAGQATIAKVELGTESYAVYQRLTTNPTSGHKIIGRGEAASIALAKANEGIVASNNLRDILVYIEEYRLANVTTGDILYEAYQKSLITESQGNVIWFNMLNKRRRLGYKSFTEYLQTKKSNN